MTRALLVIDVQNSYFDPHGSMYRFRGPVLDADAVLARIGEVVDSARAAGDLVVFTRHGYRAGYADGDRSFRSTFTPVIDEGGLLLGTWDTEVSDALTLAEGDVVVDKARFDAFHGTSLQMVLSGAGVRDLRVCGVLTNVCVESTVRTARELDYDIEVLADCVSTRDRALHEGSLAAMAGAGFATVVPWQCETSA